MKRYKGKSTLEVLEGAENYNRWIAEMVEKKLKLPILEVGSGTGNITNYFVHSGTLYATDVDKNLVGELKKKFVAKKNIHALVLDIEKQTPKKFIQYFSSIFAVNVLEHIQNDERALRNMNRLLHKDGSLVLLVPAKKRAYTRLDKEIGHFRRYEKEELRKKIETAGFVIEDIFYFNIVGLVSWIVRDKIEGNNIQMKPYQIALFDRIVPIVKRIESLARPPIGISLIVYARKK